MISEFVPTPWPEDRLPPEALAYKNCEVCSEKSRVIWGEGNPLAPIVIILDNPGAREDKYGKEFVCGTRRTLQKTLDAVHLSSDDLYLTYLLKCRPLRKYNKEAARAFSKPFLQEQIRQLNPQFIVGLGNVVVQAIFADSTAQVRKLRGRWHLIMGKPAIVSYHPLAIRRRPNLWANFKEDWQILARRFLEKRPAN